MADSYSAVQARHDQEYQNAWDNAPESFKRRASAAGLEAMPDDPENLGVMEYDEVMSRVHAPGHAPSFYVPDMAATLDTYIDNLIEKYGQAHEPLIRSIAADLKVPMLQEIEKNRALLLGKAVLYLVKSQSNTILARSHQLIHAIPGVAMMAGFGSMRKSAKACRVSCEWIRRGRDRWCAILELPIPSDGRKSDEAKERYRQNGLNNHWRRQVVKPTQPKPPCLNRPKLKPIRMLPAPTPA